MRSNSKKLGEMVASFNDIVEQTYYYEQKVYEWSKKVEKNKEAINKNLGRKNKAEVNVDDKTSFKVVKNVQTHIDFFPEKLKAALIKEKFEKVVNKTVLINDLDGLVKMLKDYGVPPKKFKEFITVKTEVDVEKIDNLIEMGEMEIEDINGCYKVEFDEDIRVIKTK